MIIKALSNTSLKLKVVGNGELYDYHKNEAKKHHVKIEFIGNISNEKLPVLYNKHNIFIMCSRYEGNPKALLEAMACGCSVIGTDVNGINDIIKHNVTGILVPEDADILKKTIFSLLERPKLCAKLGQNARNSILQNNSFIHSVNSEIDLYNAISKHNN